MADEDTIGSGFKIGNLYMLYRIIRDISTDFKTTNAFKLGLIDEKGTRLKKAETPEEKEAVTFYKRFIFNIKRALGKVGLNNKIATFAGALFLMREGHRENLLTEDGFQDEDYVISEIVRNMKYLEKNSQKNYKQLQEEIANVTGPAVAGTGDDPVHWAKQPYRVGEKGDRKKKGRYINGVAYLKKMAKEAAKKQES